MDCGTLFKIIRIISFNSSNNFGSCLLFAGQDKTSAFCFWNQSFTNLVLPDLFVKNLEKKNNLAKNYKIKALRVNLLKKNLNNKKIQRKMSNGCCFGDFNLNNDFNCYRNVGSCCHPNCFATVPRALITAKYLKKNSYLSLSFDEEDSSAVDDDQSSEEFRYKRGSGPKKPKNRAKEILKFQKKFNDSLQKLKNESGKEISKKIHTKLKHILGKGELFIIFDCKNPSYYGPDTKLVRITNKQILKSLRKTDSCSAKSENLWHFHGNMSFISTFDHKAKNLSSSVLPFDQFIGLFNDLDLCEEFMKLMRHPSFYNKVYKKPSQCVKSSSPKKSANKKNKLPNRPDAPKFGFHQQHFQQFNHFNPWARFAQFNCGGGGGGGEEINIWLRDMLDIYNKEKL
ncbi:hypothetical protein BpHYR1_021675 [Brachionus plicatilis]|uniref:Uncharacterized protein n=1 Tax=Brachionus plicatilis TaxID=10195 RepID=A0A3M7RUI4_BRAPC|nr:hypothetical protein BpHYR1_021675 [Brachionus plicatilis]